MLVADLASPWVDGLWRAGGCTWSGPLVSQAVGHRRPVPRFTQPRPDDPSLFFSRPIRPANPSLGFFRALKRGCWPSGRIPGRDPHQLAEFRPRRLNLGTPEMEAAVSSSAAAEAPIRRRAPFCPLLMGDGVRVFIRRSGNVLIRGRGGFLLTFPPRSLTHV